MSTYNVIKRFTINDLARKKALKEPIVSLTAYQAFTAQLADPYCDFLLVGDSLGMIVYGMETTIGVTLDMMINHAKAVKRGSKQALIVVDMPFGSYEASKEQAFSNAAKLMEQSGCNAVKLEGGVHMAPIIEFLTKRGIPVMAHIGLTPQSVNSLGGFKTQGRKREEWARIEKDAKAVEEAGAFAVVLEGIVEDLAIKLSEDLKIITIGIGASRNCDGQILVMEDMLGAFSWTPKFVKRYANIQLIIEEAIKNYASEVKMRSFPSEKEVYR